MWWEKSEERFKTWNFSDIHTLSNCKYLNLQPFYFQNMIAPLNVFLESLTQKIIVWGHQRLYLSLNVQMCRLKSKGCVVKNLIWFSHDKNPVSVSLNNILNCCFTTIMSPVGCIFELRQLRHISHYNNVKLFCKDFISDLNVTCELV